MTKSKYIIYLKTRNLYIQYINYNKTNSYLTDEIRELIFTEDKEKAKMFVNINQIEEIEKIIFINLGIKLEKEFYEYN